MFILLYLIKNLTIALNVVKKQSELRQGCRQRMNYYYEKNDPCNIFVAA